MCWHNWLFYWWKNNLYRECRECSKRQGKVTGFLYGKRWANLSPFVWEPFRTWLQIKSPNAE